MEAIRQTIVDVDLTKSLHRVFSGVLLARNDKLANRMGANVFQDGEAANLAGYTVKGYFIRNGTETIVIDDGGIIGNQAYVDLPGNCYFYDGSYTLTIKLCQGGQELALVIFDGQVGNTITETFVENESVINVEDFIQQDWLNRVETAAETALEQASVATEAATAAEEAWNGVQDGLAQKAPAIFVDASGDIVSITDGAAMPVQSLVSHIEPVQSGSGVPSPDNVRAISGWDAVNVTGAGKNLFHINKTGATTIEGVTFTHGTDGTIIVSGTATASRYYHLTPGSANDGVGMEVPPGTYRCTIGHTGSYTSNDTLTFVIAAYKNGTYMRGVASFPGELTVNEGEVVECYFRTINGNTYNDIVFKPMLAPIGASEDYEPYQSQTLTADLPETVYGGTLNWTTGELTVDWKMVDLGSLTWAMKDNNHFYTSKAYTSADGRPGGDMICTHYVTSTAASSAIGQNALPDKSIWANGWAFSATNLVIKDTSYSDVESFTASLAGVKLVFKTNAPYTIQLTPQQMETLKGVNNIWSDAGATEVTYIADTKMYIDNKIAAIAAAIV